MPVLIVLIVMMASLAFVKMGLDYSRDKLALENQEGRSDNELGMSELREMIQEAVREAVDPIAERVDHMENRLLPEGERQKQLPSAQPEDLDDEDE